MRRTVVYTAVERIDSYSTRVCVGDDRTWTARVPRNRSPEYCMLVIRKKQLDALSTAQRTSFDNRMLVHLKKFFQPQYDALGEERALEAVHYGEPAP